MATITLSNIHKRYEDNAIIKGLDLTIREGEFVALVGPSGCGKSTLLRMIAGLESISGGEIALDGEVINDISPQARNIAMVFQNYALYPHMTVADNLGFSLKMQGVKKALIDERVAQVAVTLGLSTLLKRKPGQLSGGQRQRVAMGRAILRNPRVFLFDEPLSNLDAKLRVEMRTEIKALHQRLNATMVYVTHDQVEAMTMADRIVVLKDGVIEQVGTPLELYDRPRNAFVAGFIGSPSMNLLSGRIDRESVVTDDGLRLPLINIPAVAQGKRVLYGVRPEHFTQVAQGGVAAEVNVVEPTGAETQIALNIGKQKAIAVFRDRVQTTPGSELQLLPDVHQAHLFDEQSGARIN
ncbi:sn-glycerol-3-phosphate ABC transporter ATP-binding protein UgpC [Enterobacteriaceae bacterium H20N1]|uniref:Sn-glycerol-3-phosphate ABC transporter ATP-binding protein UgpC n=1 Tax=Dryocola boscaweniae TaxID=2925397 RepID=A0A9X3AQY1_9ENTR|nr:sn-glycerol-3-phosphate ABC transporter ATP-binding protein UgpC [Dryocola boscaweniae]MCT4703880.1 sn-glycerol-3-phosphate ABC transporter ATP-binding protein UgpC [Dryocola boscaweniae]MCT4721048.1 sn-glycerol-3-phosphate ABC transporter ATP-binding protein UgpC [Dryocola boscaweniae]